MSNPKVSIIVPIYKAENYLSRCVDSILEQTFTEFELLLIDDGSPDKSGIICDEYALKDSRVRVIHKKNGGVSSARQCGMDNSLGDYTIHADPDDWVEPNMLKELYSKALEEDSDMVICDFLIERKTGQEYIKQEPSSLDNNTVLKELFLQLHGSCCNKLIRRECYKEFNIRFPNEMSLWEDGYVMFNLTMHPIKISYLPGAYYHYDNCINENSITRKPTAKDLDSMKFLINFLESHLDTNEFKEEFYIRKCEVKMLAFRLGLKYNEFIKLYKEINIRFVEENNMGTNLQHFVALSLTTNALIYTFLRIIYLLYKAIFH